jgi:4-hydroxybenzoate polyprenyltransferase
MWLKRSLDFFLYTHIYIGLCAVALCWGIFTVFGGAEAQNAYLVFAFCGTVWVYNLHRTVGLQTTDRDKWPRRFRIFYRLRHFNILWALLTMLTAVYAFFTYLFNFGFYLLPPIAVSLVYVIPLNSNKLVRSIPYLKIFLISFTWAWVTVVFPLLLMDNRDAWLIFLLSIERFLFIMAIDIPFDIRDYEQDARQSVNTLVHKIGVDGSKQLAIYLLVVSSLLSLIATYLGWVPSYYSIIHIGVYLLATYLVFFTKKERKDAYYSFGLDGTMLLIGILEVVVYYLL